MLTELDVRLLQLMNDVLFMARSHRRHLGLPDDSPLTLEVAPTVMAFIDELGAAELFAGFNVTVKLRDP